MLYLSKTVRLLGIIILNTGYQPDHFNIVLLSYESVL